MDEPLRMATESALCKLSRLAGWLAQWNKNRRCAAVYSQHVVMLWPVFLSCMRIAYAVRVTTKYITYFL